MKNLVSLPIATLLLLLASCTQPKTNHAAISKKAHELFSANQLDEVVNMASDNIQVVNYATGQTFNGKTEFRNFMAGFKTAFPDLVIKHTVVFEDETGNVALEFEGEATHTGPLAGVEGTIPPTGKKVRFQVCETHRIENGKIVSIHNYQDSGSLMRQLGLLPVPGEVSTE